MVRQCLHNTMHSILHGSTHAVGFASPRYGISRQFYLYFNENEEKALVGSGASAK